MAQFNATGMPTVRAGRLTFVLRILVCALILKVTAAVVVNYRNYLPPDFNSDFLRGRESYFAGGYQWAFYSHIAVGPIVLILGLAQLNDRFRQRSPQWHRNLGKLQIACILLVLAPSGLWMAFYAETGAVAGVSFALLAAATALTAWCGWRAAMRRRFAHHRQWMMRCYLLLCSAVVIRVIGGAVSVAGIQGDWTYPLASWVSWLVPLATFEVLQRRRSASGEVAPTPMKSEEVIT